jgi:hypothetical protein
VQSDAKRFGVLVQSPSLSVWCKSGAGQVRLPYPALSNKSLPPSSLSFVPRLLELATPVVSSLRRMLEIPPTVGQKGVVAIGWLVLGEDGNTRGNCFGLHSKEGFGRGCRCSSGQLWIGSPHFVHGGPDSAVCPVGSRTYFPMIWRRETQLSSYTTTYPVSHQALCSR